MSDALQVFVSGARGASTIPAPNAVSSVTLGAKFDGATDDTAAHQAAINLAAASGLYWTPGGVGVSMFSILTLPPTLKGVNGPGAAVCTLKATRIARTNGAQLITSTGALQTLVTGFTVDVDDDLFLNTIPLFFFQGNRVRTRDVLINGKYQFAVGANTCSSSDFNDIEVNTTATTVLANGSAGYGFYGEFCNDCTASVRVFGPQGSGATFQSGRGNILDTCYSEYTVTGFGLSLASEDSSEIRGGFVRNSMFEAYQLTDTVRCRVEGRCEWDSAHGMDFAASINGTQAGGGAYENEMAIQADNAFKGVGVAGHAQRNRLVVQLQDCAVRGVAAGAITVSAAGLACYVEANGDQCVGNRFEGQIINSAGTVTYGVLEFNQIGGTSLVGSNEFFQLQMTGVTTDYVLFQGVGGATTSLIWDRDEKTYAAVATPTAGAFGASPAPQLTAYIKRSGRRVEGRGRLTFAAGSNGTGAGAITVSLPSDTAGLPVVSGTAWGRESTLHGLGVDGDVASSGFSLQTSANGYPGGDGAQINYLITFERL